MRPVAQASIVVFSFASTALAVWLVRRHAVARHFLDIPNDRSSHSRPTPRGGGLGIVMVVAGMWAAATIGWPPARQFGSVACLAALLAVAGVGWIDDRRGLSVRVRLIVHLLGGTAVALLAVGGAPRLAFSLWTVLVAIFWLLWVTSAINVVNFMDGIDGLIASQAAIALSNVASLAPDSGVARPFSLMVAAACLGFLVWNWPPARVFLGDVGSGSVGFLLAVAGALLLKETNVDFARTFLPLFPLFLDSAWTMLRRMRKGERLTVAHRSHLYQRLANGAWGHGRVALAFAAAALPGAGIAAVPSARLRWMFALAYAIGVLLVGRRLDRVVPFEWGSRESEGLDADFSAIQRGTSQSESAR